MGEFERLKNIFLYVYNLKSKQSFKKVLIFSLFFTSLVTYK